MYPPTYPHAPTRVVWTHAAERQLQHLLNRTATATAPAASRVGTIAHINADLGAAFHTATDLVVLDLFLGFRPRVGEFILLVDIRDRVPDLGGTAVVKLGPDDALRREADAWENCRPPGVNGDSVFMGQQRRYHRDRPHQVVAVAYQDAQRHVGGGRLISLEDAFVGAVRFGSPSVDSVAQAIRELFDKLEENLYTGTAVNTVPLAPGIELFPTTGTARARLDASFPEWEAGDPLRVRWQASPLQASGGGPVLFRDPVKFFQTVAADLASKDAARIRRWDRVRLHHGPAHGDLHGRNVLVGVTDNRDGFGANDNRADHPALFDYEHMARNNLIAWDFAKLEIELKTRAYRHAFPYPADGSDRLPPIDFLRNVLAMERQLTEEKKAFVRPDQPTTNAQERLFSLLRALRTAVALHLGTRRQKHNAWRDEYLFVLAAYGVYSVRWPVEPHQRAATFVAAGAAAAHF